MQLCIICLFLFYLITISSATFNGISVEMPFWEVLNLLSLEKIVNNDSLRATDTQQCINHLELYKSKIQNETWAMQMFDASTKIPESVLMGLLMHLGNFDECLGVENIVTDSGNLNGQHCLATVSLNNSPSRLSQNYEYSTELRNKIADRSENTKSSAIASTNLNLQMSYCIPSSCSAQDFQTVFNKYLSSLSGGSTMGMNISVSVSQGNCHTSTGKKFATEDWITVGVLAFIAILAVTSTAYDLFKTEPKNKLLTAFSWYSNGKKLLSTETSGDTLHAVHGIRFLSICWVVLGHRYSAVIAIPAINAITVQDIITDFWRTFITNANIAVDTFLFLSGLLVSYVFLKQMSKEKASFNIPLYYIHRYIRLTPPYAIMVLLTATLLRYAGSGPLYGMLGNSYARMCQENWWTSILYINNYVEPENMCVTQSWYLSVDMQLFILSPIILYPLWKWPKKWSLSLLGALIVGGLITAFTVSYVEELTPNPFSNNPNSQKMQYYPTHTRFTPWLIGVAFGVLFHETKRKNFKLSKVQASLGWCIATIALLGSLVGIHPFTQLDNESPTSNFESSTYTALSRSSWTLGVGWVTYACVLGYGGPVNAFLSWNAFQPLSRLSYCVYLVHISYQVVRIMSIRTAIYITDLNLMPDTISDVVISLFFAAVLSLCVESPIIVLERYILGGGKSTKHKLQAVTKHQINETKVDINSELGDVKQK